MMDWKLLIYSFLAFSAMFFFLFFANYPRHLRYKQRCFPIVAFVLSALAIFLYIYPQAFAEEIVAKIRDWINQYMGLTLPSSPDRFPLLLNLLLFLLFFVLKISWRLISGIISFGFWLIDWFRRVIFRRKPTKQQPRGIFPAYSNKMDRGVTLLDGWIYPGQYLRIMGIIAAVFLYGAIICDFLPTPFHPSLVLPDLPVVPFLLFLESAWYLGGLRPNEATGVITGSDALSAIEGRFERLWQTYRSLWNDRLLAASPDLGNRSDGLSIVGKSHASGKMNDADLQLVEQCLNRQKIKLLPAQKSILSDLWGDRDLIVIEPIYEQVAPVLFARLQQHLLAGHNILFLVPEQIRFQKTDAITAWIERWLDFPCFYQTPYMVSWGIEQSNNVCISSTNELLHDAMTNHPKWLNRVRAVVVLDAMETISPNISGTLALTHCLAAMAGTPPQYIFLSQEDRINMESALRDFIGVEPEEYRLHHVASQCRRYLVWKYEGENTFQNEVIENDRFLGCEPALVIPAIRDKVANIMFVGMEKVPWREALEELDKSLQTIEVRDVVKNIEVSSMAISSEMPVVITHDALLNAPITIKQGLSLGKKDVLVLSASPPYLLRDYFTSSMDFFLATDATLRTRLAPSPLLDKYTIAYTLLTLLQHCSVRRDIIAEKLKQTHSSENVEQGLDQLFKEVFGFELLRKGWLGRESRFDFDLQSKSFKEMDYYRFIGSPLNELEYCRIVDQTGNIMALLPQEHIFQLYIPGQIHVFDGEPYRVVSIDKSEHKLKLQHAPSPSLCRYLSYMVIDNLDMGKQMHAEATIFQRCCFSVALCEAIFHVTTLGYHTLYFKDVQPSYNNIQNGVVPVREYNCGRMMQLKISQLDMEFNRQDIAVILALLLQEAFRTIFPESWHFLLVIAPGKALPSREAKIKSADLLPVDLLPSLKNDIEEEPDELSLYFFEDSHRDMGLVKALYYDCLNIFDMITDYTTWLLDNSKAEKFSLVQGTPCYIARKDIEICQQIFANLTSSFAHPMKQQREEFTKRKKETGAATKSRSCDFCGEKISGSSFERLSDGRERCTSCKDSAVESLTELEQIYDEARKWLARRFSPVQLRKDIKIYFTTADEVARERGSVFAPTSGFDPRAIGFARRARHEIYIENGQPYHMTLGTLIHEMTHIWQFDNLDMEKMEREHGDLYEEGHATWVEVQCLNERGIGIIYSEYQMQRDDVYGNGARAIETLVLSRSPSNNPFIVLKNMFPKGLG